MVERLTAPLEEFKPREVEIINLMADGLSNKEIAETLFIATSTVRWYNKQIYSKLGTSRRTEAIALAREMGIIGDGETVKESKVEHILPVTTGPFIGRNEETADLTNLLQNPDIRLISIIATGGMGKSRLALELGHLVKDNYKHGVVFIDLTAVTNPDDIAKQTVASLGLTVSSHQDPIDVIINYCRKKELLLVFDNFEQLLKGASILSAILETAPRITIIATSRERLQLRIETVYYLEPIMDNGGKLFIEMARMMRPNIHISEIEREEVEQIVELVGGLPLGLVLAASWVDTLSVAEITKEIKASLDFLSAEMSDVPKRQRSIHAVIDPTWNRLSEQEQKAFMWASVFRGGFTRKHFQKVTGASVRSIQTLLSRSLIAHGHKRRYVIHPLVRQYAEEKLIENKAEFQRAKQTHFETFLAFTQIQNERMFNGFYLESLEAIDDEIDNLRSALDWSFSSNSREQTLPLVLELCEYWWVKAESKEAVYYLEQALPNTTNARLYRSFSRFHFRLGNVEIAIDSLEKTIDIAQHTSDYDELTLAYSGLSFYHYQSNPEVADLMAQKAYEASQILKTPRVVANCLNHYATILVVNHRDAAQSLEYYQQALDISKKLGDLWVISTIAYNIALAYEEVLGDTTQAKKYCEYSLKIKRNIGDRLGVARRLTMFAFWEIAEENFDLAKAYIAESRAICEEFGEPIRLAHLYRIEGLLLLITNQYDKARPVLESALEMALAAKTYFSIIPAYCYLALLHLLEGQILEARLFVFNAIESDTGTGIPAWTSVITFANYLWYEGQIDRCVEISAVLHLNQDQFTGERIDTLYFLKPLVYRLKRRIGEEAWENALDEAEGISVEAIFEEIVVEVANDRK